MSSSRPEWYGRALVLILAGGAVFGLVGTLTAPHAYAAAAKPGRYVITQATHVSAAAASANGVSAQGLTATIEGTTFILLDTETGDSWITTGKTSAWTKFTRE